METPSQADLVCLYLDEAGVTDADGERARDDGTGQSGGGGRSEAASRGTVEAIADVLELDRETTPERLELLSTLEEMEAEGLVVREAIATTDDTARSTYRLTEEGRQRAASLRNRYRDRTVTVTDGTEQRMTVADLDRYFEEHPLVRALARLTEDGEVPLQDEVGDAFVDRDTELGLLEETLERTRQQGSHTVLVSGEAGVGKTALIEQWLPTAREAGYQVAAGRCRQVGDRPYGPLVAAFRDLPDSEPLIDPLETAAREVTDPETFDAQRTALFNEVASALRSRAADDPIVVFLDDLQWADPDTRQLFAHLTRSVTDWLAPVVFVGAYRSEAAAADRVFDGTLERVADADRTIHLALDPLPPADSHGLIAWVADASDLPDAFLETVQERTGGNPLLVRETVQQLIDTGEVDPADPETMPTSPGEFPVPEDVSSVIATRINTLPDATREVLEATAVAGGEVLPALVADVVGTDEATVNDHLDVLVAGRFLERTPDGVAFVGGLVRESVVEYLPEERRRRLHAAVADALESLSPDAEDSLAGRIAHHYAAAGDHWAALEYYRWAGERAEEVYAHEDAREAYERALGVARDLGEDAARRELLESIGDVTTLLGRYETAHDRFAAARDLAESVATRQRLIRKQAETHYYRGDLQAGIETVEEGLSLANDATVPEDTDATATADGEAAGNPEVAALLNAQALCLIEAGDPGEARDVARRARERAREADAPTRAARALRRQGRAAHRQGDFETSVDRLEDALEIAREHDDRLIVAQALRGLGRVAREQGDHEGAREYYERSLDLYRELGHRNGEAGALNNIGTVVYDEGDLEAAADYFERALEIYRTIGDRRSVGMLLNNVGRLAWRRGLLDEAEDHLEEALSVARDLENRSREAIPLFNLAEIARDRGDPEAAADHARQALDLFREVGDRNFEARTLVNLGAIEADRGDTEAAVEYVEEGLELARDLDITLREAEALIARGEVATAREEYDRAATAISEGLALAREADKREFEIEGLFAKGQLARERGDNEAAAETFEEGLALAREAGHRLQALDALEELVDLYDRLGDHATAREHCETALEVVAESDAASLARREMTFRSLADRLPADVEVGATDEDDD